MTGKKPPEVEAKIIDGRLAKFYRETCLLDQTFVRDESITINELLGALASKINEKIVIRRFMRFETGEGL
jgi:elongation factor Ts